jgi:hypothetical protein
MMVTESVIAQVTTALVLHAGRFRRAHPGPPKDTIPLREVKQPRKDEFFRRGDGNRRARYGPVLADELPIDLISYTVYSSDG